MKIRRANKDDYQEILRLFTDFVEQPDRYVNKDNDSFLQFIDSENNFVDVAEEKGNLYAFVTYSIRTVVRYPKPVLEVEELYVDPKYRKSGIGTKLLERVIDFAKRTNSQQIHIVSDLSRLGAHEFYQKVGFEKHGYYFKKVI